MEVWRQLLFQHPDSTNVKWDHELQALRVKFSNLNTVERKTFQRQLKFKKVDLSELGLGKFDAIPVSEGPIILDTLEDAMKWAKWIVTEQHLTDYVDDQKWD